MNILWILEDALRPDHMGCYGYPKPTTPNCDALARDGVRFEAAIATASHTLPPIVSMIMGQTAATHKIVNCAIFARWKNEGLWRDARTPLHILAEHGYLVDGELVSRWAPLGFTRDTPGDAIAEYFGKHREHTWFFYAEPYPTHLPYNPPEEYVDLFLADGYAPSAGTRERTDVVRTFLIVHPSGMISKLEAGEDDPLPDDETDEAHKRTAGTVDLLAEDVPYVNALYDGEVRVFDDMVGRWVARLKELGLYQDTLIVLTADHGEELMDRGHVGHCSCNLNGTLYDESIRVPLIMSCPGRLPRGVTVANQVSHIDIMPTIFDLLGLQPFPRFDGTSLLPLIRGDVPTFRPEAYAETTPAGWQALHDDQREIWCVRTEQWKLILNTDSRDSFRAFELYHLATDPGERRDVFDQQGGEVVGLTGKLNDYIARARE